jgi:hypothetical protein
VGVLLPPLNLALKLGVESVPAVTVAPRLRRILSLASIGVLPRLPAEGEGVAMVVEAVVEVSAGGALAEAGALVVAAASVPVVGASLARVDFVGAGAVCVDLHWSN